MDISKNELLTVRLIYCCTWLLTGIIAACFETDLLPTGWANLGNESAYALNMLCVMLTLGGSYVALRLFTLKQIHKRISTDSKQWVKWSITRISLLSICILINLISYYALFNGSAPLYCLLITLTAFVFCWPQQEQTVEDN